MLSQYYLPTRKNKIKNISLILSQNEKENYEYDLKFTILFKVFSINKIKERPFFQHVTNMINLAI